jgi:hypothetical protein
VEPIANNAKQTPNPARTIELIVLVRCMISPSSLVGT